MTLAIMPRASSESQAANIFASCVDAIRAGELITRVSSRDKEFHFQDWVKARIASIGLHFEEGGRNSYPDFRLVEFTEGYEVKGLAYPGRDADYDCNSQIPMGLHNGRRIFYVFGRYPAAPDGNQYPVVDLVVCDAYFLNADTAYVHENRSFVGFGSYGDIKIRDRKMYIAPTPFALTDGTAGQHTLILREGEAEPDEDRFESVGSLERREADLRVVGYSFDLTSNELELAHEPNPTAGRTHRFTAYRLSGTRGSPVTMAGTAQA